MRKWKHLDQWEQKEKGTLPKREKTEKHEAAGHIYKKIEVDEEKAKEQMLSEKNRIFCLAYLRNHNATQAAIRAGYSKKYAGQIGYQLLQKPIIREQIKKYKQITAEELLTDAVDVLEKYIKIAFADITDYVDFGTRELPVCNKSGRPIIDENGNQIMSTENYLILRNSDEVDGSVIAQIAEGRNGVTIKLEDRHRALEVLKDYFDLCPDRFKREMQRRLMELRERESEMKF